LFFKKQLLYLFILFIKGIFIIVVIVNFFGSLEETLSQLKVCYKYCQWKNNLREYVNFPKKQKSQTSKPSGATILLPFGHSYSRISTKKKLKGISDFIRISTIFSHL
jgi:hypothetical protein